MISVVGIAGWFVIGMAVGFVLAFLLVAHWDKNVELGYTPVDAPVEASEVSA